MYKLVVTELANQDLDQIVSYIAVELANQKAAGDFLDEVRQCYAHLKDNPLMYAKCDHERLASDGYRKAIIKNYVLIYIVDEDSKTVRILRFFYGARDYGKLI